VENPLDKLANTAFTLKYEPTLLHKPYFLMITRVNKPIWFREETVEEVVSSTKSFLEKNPITATVVLNLG
jgi:hypothetical protein